jgi:uncharacterized protein
MEASLMNEPVVSAIDPSIDDRRWALLAYLFTPVVPLLLLLVENARQRPFVRAHLPQALALGVIQVGLLILSPFTACLSSVAFLLFYVAIFYWGLRAYNGELFDVPVVSKYVREQGWMS